MAAKRAARQPAQALSGEVDAFVASLTHPHKPELLKLRSIILGADRSITEGIKWNSISFRTTEWFATFHLRARDGIPIILHLGAKHKDNSARLAIKDPQGLLSWLATDRAMVTFRDMKDIEARRAALEALIRQWIRHVA